MDAPTPRNDNPPRPAIGPLPVLGALAAAALAAAASVILRPLLSSDAWLMLYAGIVGVGVISALAARWRIGPYVVAAVPVTAYVLYSLALTGWALSCPTCGEEAARPTYVILGMIVFGSFLALVLGAITVGGALGRLAWRRTG